MSKAKAATREKEAVDPRELMRETLKEVRLYGERLAAACSTIHSHFQQGRKGQGVELLKQFLQGMDWMSQALYLTLPYQRERRADIDLNQLPNLLNPLLEALENQDFGLIGDLLLYEVQPVLFAWNQQLGVLLEGDSHQQGVH